MRSDMGDKDGKTEKPTPKRIRDSRKRGEVAKSPDVVAAVALFVFAMLFVPLCEFSINHFSPYFVNDRHRRQHRPGRTALYGDSDQAGFQKTQSAERP